MSNGEDPRLSAWQQVVGVVRNATPYALAIFLPVRTLAWWRGWALLAVVVATHALGNWRVARVNGSLLVERQRPVLQEGQPMKDKLILLSFMAALAVEVGVASFDGMRRHWLGSPGIALSALGLALYLLGSALVVRALLSNAFAARVVRHQPERGHTVVEAGPYQVVRHPMYAGLVLQSVAMPLWLGSWVGLLLAAFPIGLLAVRITVEERVLRDALPAYAVYADRVRHRLIPGVW